MRTPNNYEAFLIEWTEIMYPFIQMRKVMIKYFSELSKEFSKIVKLINKGN